MVRSRYADVVLEVVWDGSDSGLPMQKAPQRYG